MATLAIKTVRDYAVENPNATRVFEKYGIDYCCGGHKPLADACAAANVDVNEVLKGIEGSGPSTAGNTKDWRKESLTALVEHINSTHHVYVKEEVPRLTQLIAKVVAAHGTNHPELLTVQEI